MEVDWERVRQPLRPQDQVLSAITRRWQAALTDRHRPDHLCAMYPRVANRLALCWDDASLASKVLDELVVDKRRGRIGFPPAVSQELIQLRLLRPAPQTLSSIHSASVVGRCKRASARIDGCRCRPCGT